MKETTEPLSVSRPVAAEDSEEYILEEDRNGDGSAREGAPVFLLGYMPLSKWEMLLNSASKAAKDSAQPSEMSRFLRDQVQWGLKGWKGIYRKNGEEIVFEGMTDNVSGVQYSHASDKDIENLSRRVWSELSNAIVALNNFGDVEKKA
jgi:hypothetical protein